MQKRSRAVRFKRIGCGTRPLWAMETAKRTRLSVRISPRETLKSKGRLQWSRSEENGVETDWKNKRPWNWKMESQREEKVD